MKGMTGRLDQSLPVGSEGAGVVVEAGDSQAARSLLGKKVAALGGAMYSQYRCLKAADCLVLPETATAADGASSFINPLTALGMVETMRVEKHRGLVHTAAASNVGQMLNRLCLADGVPLVNIVRKREQLDLLRAASAEHVCDSSDARFMDDLTEAARTRQLSVVLSSHLVSDLERTCDWLIVLNDGRVRAAGPLRGLLAAHPGMSTEDMVLTYLEKTS